MVGFEYIIACLLACGSWITSLVMMNGISNYFAGILY